MGKQKDTVVMKSLPKCDLCDEEARYDGKTVTGQWAYMCPDHYISIGVGVGLGIGQRLMKESEVSND